MTTKRALVCAPLMPEFDRESGSRRVLDLILFLRHAGWAVSFAAENGRGGERYAEMLRQLGVATYDRFGPETDELMSSGCLDLAVCVFWYTADKLSGKLRRRTPRTRVIVDTIDLHFLRHARGLLGGTIDGGGEAHGGEAAPGRLGAKYGEEMVKELNAYAAADGVLTVSQKEADLLNDLCGVPALARVVPDSEDLAPSPVPLAERRGVAFIGNFRHPPNVDAAEFLCTQVLPRVDLGLLEQHPVYVVGNSLNDRIRAFADGLPNVRMVGWVPSVMPYLERARVSVIPLRYGAGTKRKMIQALMVGTPTVSTSAGAEGMDVEDGRHALVADDPGQFAAAIERLLRDDDLWSRLATAGRGHMLVQHGHETARTRLLEAVSAIMKRPRRSGGVAGDSDNAAGAGNAAPTTTGGGGGRSDYDRLRKRVRQAVCDAVPAKSTVIVVSKGDEELLKLDGRRGWHFPQADGGVYAGHHPEDSTAAVKQLESLRGRGGQFLVFPETSLWWLKHYDGLRRHLEHRYRQVVREEGTCVIYELRTPTSKKHAPGKGGA